MAVGEKAVERRPTLIASVQRALHLLDAVATEAGPVPAKVLARRVDLPLATTYHLLRTLVEERYLARLDGGYVLGARVHELRLAGRARFLACGMPVLEQVRDTLGAAAYFGALQDGDLRLVGVADGPRTPRVQLWVGLAEAAHATALGKATLAALEQEERRDYLARHRLVDLTPWTITSPERLLAGLELEAPAVDRQEYELGVACLGVSVRAAGVVGALAVSVPLSRAERLAAMGPELRRGAHRLELALAASGSA
jgi:IclR family acetate operon transcriptional repressor